MANKWSSYSTLRRQVRNQTSDYLQELMQCQNEPVPSTSADFAADFIADEDLAQHVESTEFHFDSGDDNDQTTNCEMSDDEEIGDIPEVDIVYESDSDDYDDFNLTEQIREWAVQYRVPQCSWITLVNFEASSPLPTT